MFEDFFSRSQIQQLGYIQGVEIAIKRDDLIHEFISGNKLFKLKYNLLAAQNFESIVTFGGAFSNHIAATAAFGNLSGIKTFGIIRGERSSNMSSTLEIAKKNGMQLEFITREEYRKKNDTEFLDFIQKGFPNSYIIPEGGANALGVQGAEEILNASTARFSHIITAMGTGTTFAGIVKSSVKTQKVIGIPIHKHENLLDDILKFDPAFNSFLNRNFEIVVGYHFGGYAKWKPELIDFIQQFHLQFEVKLDPIYTGKAMFALLDLIEKKKIKRGSKVLFIHTGGLQGISGFERRFGIKLF